MEKMIKLLAPRSRLGVVTRVLLFTAALSLANIVFSVIIAPLLPDVPFLYGIARAVFVAMPLLCLLFGVMM